MSLINRRAADRVMDCSDFQHELPDLVLMPGAMPSPAAAAHLQICPPCTEEYLSYQQTFNLLNTWTVPAPTPFFDQKLAVRMREQQAAAPMGWFERLSTRLQLNTGRGFRPAMAGALALCLALAGGGYAGLSGFHSVRPVEASATVKELQVLDRNEEALQQMDALQQDDDTSSQGTDDSGQTTNPSS